MVSSGLVLAGLGENGLHVYYITLQLLIKTFEFTVALFNRSET